MSQQETPPRYVPQIGGDAYLKADAVNKIEHALRCIRDHHPPLWDIAAGALALALEHTRTLHAIDDKQMRTALKRGARPGREGAG